MAWDVEGTKQRVRAAAAVEFAAHGPAGATIDRIATRAGVNRERVYNYFTDKSTLFAVVVSEQLELIASSVPLAVDDLDDLAAFAGGTYDYQRKHPELARLVLWEGLYDTGTVTEELARSKLYAAKTDEVARAQQAGLIGDDLAPGYLVFMIISLSSYWAAAPQIARMLTGSAATARGEHARRRDTVVAATRALAAPSGTSQRPTVD